LKYPTLYAEQIWRQQRYYVVILMLLGAGVSLFLVLSHRWHFDQPSLIWLSYIPAGLMLAGALTFYRRRSYVQATDPGLRISRLTKSVVIEWDLVRSARVQPLGMHFQDTRKKLIRPFSRPLLERPAVFIRLRDDPRAKTISGRLGTQYVGVDTIALPVADADRLSTEIASRLPDRLGQNLGGQRRRKRGR